MAVRLQLKLGIVAEHDRLDDSPDTLVVVEPSVGSVARSKGNLYLLVTSRTSSRHALEATRLAAETIRNEYYYDESAGIRVCLQKAIATANKRLAPPGGPPRPAVDRRQRARSASASAVVRGNEMYVATVGPGRGLPDPPGAPVDAARSRTASAGCRPTASSPRSGAARSTVGDSLVLDLAQHRRPARRRRAQGRDGHAPPAVGDGAPPPALPGGRRAPAATAPSRSRRPRSPRRPAAGRSSRSGRPSRWPGRPTARRSRSPTTSRPRAPRCPRRPDSARVVAGTAFERLVAAPPRPAAAAQAGLPPGDAARLAPRDPAPRRDRRHRAAGRRRQPRDVGLGVRRPAPAAGAISSVNAGQDALDKAKANLALVSTDPGIDLIEDDRERGRRAADRGVRPARRRPRTRASASASSTRSGRTWWRCSTARTASSRSPRRRSSRSSRRRVRPPFDLRTLVRGYDSAPYVIDRRRNAVYRVDLKRKRATNIARNGRSVGNRRWRPRTSWRSVAATC